MLSTSSSVGVPARSHAKRPRDSESATDLTEEKALTREPTADELDQEEVTIESDAGDAMEDSPALGSSSTRMPTEVEIIDIDSGADHAADSTSVRKPPIVATNEGSPKKKKPKLETETDKTLAPTIPSQLPAAPATPAKYTFADLSNSESLYLALMNGCPKNDLLYRLIRIVARPSDKEFMLQRDPVQVAKLFVKDSSGSGSSDRLSRKNFKLCVDTVKALARLPFAQTFLVKLSNAQLMAYETNLTIYLARTNGVPPIDLSTMQQKLQNSEHDRAVKVDEEGFADCYPNSVAAVVLDIVILIVNACKFNPPTHVVHLQGLELADKLNRTHLPLLRRNLDIPPDLIICYICGEGDSEEGTAHGLLMECDQCALWYHQVCANVPTVPKENWFCDSCLLTNPKLSKRLGSRNTPEIGQESSFMQGSNSTASASAASYSMAAPKPRPYSQSQPQPPPPPAKYTGPIYTNINPPSSVSLLKEPSFSSIVHEQQSSTSPILEIRGEDSVMYTPANGMTSNARTTKGRPHSPDGSWLRSLDQKVQERIHRSPDVPAAPSSSEEEPRTSSTSLERMEGEDESYIRSLRVDLDNAMRVISATSERLVELQSRQRSRAAQRQHEKKAASATSKSYRTVINLLNEPIESHIELVQKEDANGSNKNGPDIVPSTIAAGTITPGSGEPVPSPSPTSLTHEQLIEKLATYRQRAVAQSAMIQSLNKRLRVADKQCAALQSQVEEVRAEYGVGGKLHSKQVQELESALNQAYSWLRDERKARNEATHQSNTNRRLLLKMVERLDRTVVGSMVPDKFGTRLLEETKQHVRTEEEIQEKRTHASSVSKDNRPGYFRPSAAAAATANAVASNQPNTSSSNPSSSVSTRMLLNHNIPAAAHLVSSAPPSAAPSHAPSASNISASKPSNQTSHINEHLHRATSNESLPPLESLSKTTQ